METKRWVTHRQQKKKRNVKAQGEKGSDDDVTFICYYEISNLIILKMCLSSNYYIIICAIQSSLL